MSLFRFLVVRGIAIVFTTIVAIFGCSYFFSVFAQELPENNFATDAESLSINIPISGNTSNATTWWPLEIEGEPVEGEVVEGEGEPVEGEGEPVEGEVVEGEPVEGEQPEGESSEGEQPEGEISVEGEGEPEGEPDHTGDLVIMLPGDVPLAMIQVPAGTFMMGRYSGEQESYIYEDPQHSVTISQNFYLGKYEVTKRQWQAVMGTTPWLGQSYVLNDLDSPVIYVSWDDAQSFITALNTHVTNTGQGAATFRLPSEAEWEYACRAGTTTRFYWGDDLDYSVGDAYCWWAYNAYDANEKYAHEVGLKLPNVFGLYDMSGNVWEWCEDDWHSSYTGAPTNGSAWVHSPRGPWRLSRGGSCYYYGYLCRSAIRDFPFPSYTDFDIGFRLSR